MASTVCILTDDVREKSKLMMVQGLREKDAYHVACAINSNADYFITTDAKILNKKIQDVRVINPIDFIFLTEGIV